ncbi:peptidase [Sandaracinomonas limnophila]|uniref:Peptidase n=1 Tax=Sandaracinomonas limnophila TaxID=1862386 RepID=A0A437PXV3_9BACT|nr:PepSY-associated TM helix domain-containing protein [Sandaracinomonas limnophila]RVU27077.1 peptidase [Sandaracinomonas limnophila]
MKLKTKLASWSRWIHIYLSMFSFIVVLFFSVTGLTLNHLEWFPEKEVITELKGNIASNWVNISDTSKIDKLKIVEFLREKNKVKGLVNDFRIDDSEISISFQGPGYAADAYIDRLTGKYELTTNEMGAIALLNDLHKGRDTTQSWKWVIDLSAIFLIVISLSGLILLLFLKKKRLMGLILLLIGGIILYFFI